VKAVIALASSAFSLRSVWAPAARAVLLPAVHFPWTEMWFGLEVSGHHPKTGR